MPSDTDTSILVKKFRWRDWFIMETTLLRLTVTTLIGRTISDQTGHGSLSTTP
jgi:hypothetical protein